MQGARLTACNNDYAARIVYKMRNRGLISLVVTSSDRARSSAGETVVSEGIDFTIIRSGISKSSPDLIEH
jgi:hypothetical protein